MGQNDIYVGEDNLVTSATIFITAEGPAQALDRALNKIDRISGRSGRIFCIETYTIKRVGEERYQISFE